MEHSHAVYALLRLHAELAGEVVKHKNKQQRANLTYDELAERMKKHGVAETRNSITAKLKRGTFPATFFIAAMVAIGAEVVKLEDI
jgi:hypothetical protein